MTERFASGRDEPPNRISFLVQTSKAWLTVAPGLVHAFASFRP